MHDGTIAAFRNGRPYGKPYQSSGLTVFSPGDAQIIFGLRHSPPQPTGCSGARSIGPDSTIGPSRPEEVAISAGIDTRPRR